MTSKNIKNLLERQLEVWGLAKKNYEALDGVLTKDIKFDNFSIRVQFNPARIQSSAAKVDAQSIQERKCFLCPQNLPSEQEGIPFAEDYQVLVNPFPIFPQHFTIPTFTHTDQLIKDRFGDMLDLAKEMDQFTIFYNGPKCGASAPDHAHFQAGNKGFLLIEKDIENIDLKERYNEEGIIVSEMQGYLRAGFLIEATDKQKAIKFFNKLYAQLEIKEGEQEPMLNIVTWYNANVETWVSVVFLRSKHRPSCYFAEGDDNILISPASVDMGGVFIVPQQKDFEKISRDNIADILNEVTIDQPAMEAIVAKVANV